MPSPTEHKTVQARILAYAEANGWAIVSREEAEERRGGIPAPLRKKDGDRNVPAPLSLFFDDLLDAKVREFNPRYAEGEGALLGQFRHLHTDIYGNWEFVGYLRNRGKFFDHEEKRERDLILIDYDDPERPPAALRNVYEVIEKWAFRTLLHKHANISGLQLADLLGHPVKQWVLKNHGLLEGDLAPFAQRVLETVDGKFNRHLYNGRIEGYGTVLFPKE